MKHRPVKQNKLFSLKEGRVERSRRYCPRCGDSFLAQHKERLTCGKCHYCEISNVQLP